MREDAPLDIVIYGASGYTGRLVAEYVQKRYGDALNWRLTDINAAPLKWGIAGRDEAKLKKTREELGIADTVPILVADSDDAQALEKMAMQAKCVITTVGPYQLYGRKLVEVCAATGTDYVDLCGEPLFMADIIKTQQAKAKETGARIVFSCGFDSIPFDLGVQQLVYAGQEVTVRKAMPFGPFTNVSAWVMAMDGKVSGGTVASMMTTMKALEKDPKLQDMLVNPFALTQAGKGVAQPPMGEARILSEKYNLWGAPFVMAPINTKNVHRSNELMGYPYGAEFCYDEMLATGLGKQGRLAAEQAGNPFGDDMPKPGEGPTEEERTKGHYSVLFYGEHKKKDALTMASLWQGDADPGYGSTAKMITESALCLVESCWGFDGGVWTPASSMGITLRYRLETRAGITTKVASEKAEIAELIKSFFPNKN